ncbi:MAG: sigma-70 family RNA polymerase sigma factor [Janthinobacterium lividum]
MAATSEGVDTASLLQRCAAGDQDAFRTLYDVHCGRLYGAALRITRQSSLAADAVHDAFLQAWQNAARFDPERGTAETWLLSLVRYRALDLARRRMREVSGADLPEEADPSPGALATLLERDDATALHGCLGELDEDRRSLICLAFMDGLTHSELAERLGAPLGSVKSRIRRGLAALRACLDR